MCRVEGAKAKRAAQAARPRTWALRADEPPT
jgi:hypothetical protein